MKILRYVWHLSIILFLATILMAYVLKSAYSGSLVFLPIIISSQDVVPSGYSISLTFDHKSFVDQGKITASGDNLRIYYDPSATFTGNQIELNRVLDNAGSWNTTATKIWFKLPNSLPANTIDSSRYRLYFGDNFSGSPLQDKHKVYEYWDDFSDGNLDKWSIDAGSWREENNLLKSESGGAQIRNKIVTIPDILVETKINSINSGQYVGVFARSLDKDHFYVFDRDGNAGEWRIYRTLGNWTLLANTNNSAAPKNGDIINIKIIGNSITAQINNQNIFTLKDTETVIGDQVGLFTNGPNSYTEFSYFLVRKAVEKEPILNLSVESSPTPTLTPTATTSPAISSSPTPTYSPTPTLTPTVTPTITPTSTPTLTTTPTLTPMPTLSITPTPTPIPDGPQMISAETQDLDSNGKIDHLKIIFDKDLNGSTVSNADFTVSSYLLGSNRAEETNGEVTLQVVEGVYFDSGAEPEITLRDHGVKDLSGNWNILHTTLAKDKIGPYILISNPNASNIYFNKSIKISGIASDFSSSEDAMATSVMLFFKETGKTNWQQIKTVNNDSFLEPFEWSLENWLPEKAGIYDLKIISSDINGNTSEKILTDVYYDLTPPQSADLQSTSHGINKWSNLGKIKIKLLNTGSDDLSGLDSFIYSFDTDKNNANILATKIPYGTNDFESQELKNSGEYYLHFQTSDKAGNFSPQKTLGPYKIDVQKPTIVITSPLSATASGIINISADAIDEISGSGINSVDFSYKTPSGETKLLTTLYQKPFTLPLDTSLLDNLGTYTISLNATDFAGNSLNVEKNIDIGTTILEQNAFVPDSSSAKISWQTSHSTSSRIVYDYVQHQNLSLPPKYGYAFSTEELDTKQKVKFHIVTISGLTSGKRYYYRTASRGSPETIGEEKFIELPSEPATTANNYYFYNSTPTPTSSETKTLSQLPLFSDHILPEVLGTTTDSGVLAKNLLLTPVVSDHHPNNLTPAKNSLINNFSDQKNIYIILIVAVLLIIAFLGKLFLF